MTEGPEHDAHRKWKKLSAPMYDWMTNHHMVWPGLACRFGGRRNIDGSRYEQTVYYSDQVGQDDKSLNKLIKQTLQVPEEGYSPMDHLNSWKENQKSPYFDSKTRHVINHPGDCNKIMEIKQVDDVVVTHGDCPEVFVWSFAHQPNHASTSNKPRKVAKSTPDLRLVGHTKSAPFALSTSARSPSIASGGEDQTIIIWNLADHAGGSLVRAPEATVPVTKNTGAPAPELQGRITLTGHTNTITSVCFKPGSDDTLMSTADDKVIKVWDIRDKRAVHSIKQVAEGDVMCSDWSKSEHFVATGADGGMTHVYDVRKFTSAVDSGTEPASVEPYLEFMQFVTPRQAVLTVSWSPRKPAWLASSGDDGRVCIYDTARPSAETADGLPSQLVLQHIGHLGNIMDCQWSPHDDYTLMSTSNDGETYKEGGALQLWRLSWLLHKPLEEAQAQLSAHQNWLETGKIEDLPTTVPQTAAAAGKVGPGSAAPAPSTVSAPPVTTAAPAAADIKPASGSAQPSASPAAGASGAAAGDRGGTAGGVGPSGSAQGVTAQETEAAPADVEMQDAG